jgi:hypothetical protein
MFSERSRTERNAKLELESVWEGKIRPQSFNYKSSCNIHTSAQYTNVYRKMIIDKPDNQYDLNLDFEHVFIRLNRMDN